MTNFRKNKFLCMPISLYFFFSIRDQISKESAYYQRTFIQIQAEMSCSGGLEGGEAGNEGWQTGCRQ